LYTYTESGLILHGVVTLFFSLACISLLRGLTHVSKQEEIILHEKWIFVLKDIMLATQVYKMIHLCWPAFVCSFRSFKKSIAGFCNAKKFATFRILFKFSNIRNFLCSVVQIDKKMYVVDPTFESQIYKIIPIM